MFGSPEEGLHAVSDGDFCGSIVLCSRSAKKPLWLQRGRTAAVTSAQACNMNWDCVGYFAGFIVFMVYCNLALKYVI